MRLSTCVCRPHAHVWVNAYIYIYIYICIYMYIQIILPGLHIRTCISAGVSAYVYTDTCTYFHIEIERGGKEWIGERGERLEGNKVEGKDSLVIYYTSEVQDLPYQRDQLRRYSGNLKNQLRPRLGFHSLHDTAA